MFWLTCDGERRKINRKNGKWEDVSVHIPLTDIKGVVMVNNEQTSLCFGCTYSYIDRDDCYNSYNAPCYDKYTGLFEDKEEASYIELTTENYLYRVCHMRLYGQEENVKLLKTVYEAIIEAKGDVNFGLIEDQQKQAYEKEREETRIQSLIYRYNRMCRQKKTCNKCKAYNDNKCAMGYKMENGKPLEPCIKPETKRNVKIYMDIKNKFEEVR
jgi:hypothetical protein